MAKRGAARRKGAGAGLSVKSAAHNIARAARKTRAGIRSAQAMAAKITGPKPSKHKTQDPKLQAGPEAQYKGIDEINSTADIRVSDRLIDQVIGQEKGIEIVRKAAQQKRNVLLIGSPGTGKSMLAQAMAELVETTDLKDVLVVGNAEDDNTPKVKIVKAGEGRKMIAQERMRNRMTGSNMNAMMFAFIAFFLMAALFVFPAFFDKIIVAAIIIGLMIVGAVMLFANQVGRGRFTEVESAKLIVDNTGKKVAPFIDGTGSRAGALLGDVKHDPFQSFDGKTRVEVNGEERTMEEIWGEMSAKYPELINRNEHGYEGIVLPKKEKLYTRGAKGRKILKGRILVINRRPYEGMMVEIRTRGRKALSTTPEHAYILNPDTRKARNLRKGKKVFVLAGK